LRQREGCTDSKGKSVKATELSSPIRNQKTIDDDSHHKNGTSYLNKADRLMNDSRAYFFGIQHRIRKLNMFYLRVIAMFNEIDTFKNWRTLVTDKRADIADGRRYYANRKR